MSTFMMFVAPLVAVTLIAMPLIPIYKGITTGKKARNTIIFNLAAFFGLAIIMIAAPVTGLVSFAEAGEAAAAATAMTSGHGMAYIAAALSTGLSALGAGIAVAAAAPAAIGAFSEDPKAFGKAIIFVALGEGVALYGMLISILIINKL